MDLTLQPGGSSVGPFRSYPVGRIADLVDHYEVRSCDCLQLVPAAVSSVAIRDRNLRPWRVICVPAGAVRLQSLARRILQVQVLEVSPDCRRDSQLLRVCLW